MPALRQARCMRKELRFTVHRLQMTVKLWASSMIHVAVEGRVFVLSSCQVTKLSDYPDYFQEQFIMKDHQEDDYLMHGVT